MPSTTLWWVIHTRAHALPKPVFVVYTTLDMAFYTKSWHKVLIRSCVFVGTLSVILTEIWRRIWITWDKP